MGKAVDEFSVSPAIRMTSTTDLNANPDCVRNRRALDRSQSIRCCKMFNRQQATFTKIIISCTA